MKQEICVIDPIYYTTSANLTGKKCTSLPEFEISQERSNWIRSQLPDLLHYSQAMALSYLSSYETRNSQSQLYVLCLRNPTYNLNCKNSYNPSVYITFNSLKVSGDKRTFTEKSSIMIFLFYHLSISDFVTSSPGNSLNKGVIDPEY